MGVACSQHNVYLIRTQDMKIVDQIGNIMNEVLAGYKGCNRLEYIEYISELSVVIVASYAANRFALIRICKSDETEQSPKMIIEGFYPKQNAYVMNIGCIQGMQCLKCDENTWRLYVLYQISNQRPMYDGVPVKIASYLITRNN